MDDHFINPIAQIRPDVTAVEARVRVNYGSEETPLFIDWTVGELDRLNAIKERKKYAPPKRNAKAVRCSWPGCHRAARKGKRALCLKHGNLVKMLDLDMFSMRAGTPLY